VPGEYTLDRGRGDRVERARFDWTAHKLALEWKSEARTVELPVGAQDPLSQLHQLYFMQPVPAAASLTVVTSRKLGRHVYLQAGEESVATPLGSVRALRFRRQEDGGAKVDVWLDLDRSLLPVRIYAIDRKGNALDQVIREVRVELTASAAERR
jgi:myo-inositol-hexaphosphate 3-phosphohydrolase